MQKGVIIISHAKIEEGRRVARTRATPIMVYSMALRGHSSGRSDRSDGEGELSCEWMVCGARCGDAGAVDDAAKINDNGICGSGRVNDEFCAGMWGARG